MNYVINYLMRCAAPCFALTMCIAHGLLQAHKPFNYQVITSKTEYTQIQQDKHPTVIIYSAPWCSACKHMEPAFHAIAGKYKHAAHFYKVNIDNPQLNYITKAYNITGLPTTIYSKNGKEVKRDRGMLHKRELEQSINQLLSTVAVAQPQQPYHKLSSTASKTSKRKHKNRVQPQAEQPLHKQSASHAQKKRSAKRRYTIS